jgi:hypothetical protein
MVVVTFHYEDRPDPFSDYRAGFEIRTSRRCRSILLETHADRVRPVRRYEFSYGRDPLTDRCPATNKAPGPGRRPVADVREEGFEPGPNHARPA